jgi:hypothetical protein
MTTAVAAGLRSYRRGGWEAAHSRLLLLLLVAQGQRGWEGARYRSRSRSPRISTPIYDVAAHWQAADACDSQKTNPICCYPLLSSCHRLTDFLVSY